MPTPANRTPLRVARGTYSNLNSSVADIQEGEICYATDQDKLYVKEGSALVSTQAALPANNAVTDEPVHELTVILEDESLISVGLEGESILMSLDSSLEK